MVFREPSTWKFLLVLPLLALASGSARAIAIWPSMPGSWVGFSESVSLPAVQLPAVQFAVTRQDKGRFSGEATVTMGDGSVRFFCDGSVQPNPERGRGPSVGNVVNVAGLSADGALALSMHGKTVAMGDGSVRVASLRYDISDASGNVADHGYLLLLQRIGGIAWGDLRAPTLQESDWLGTWTSALYPETRARMTVGGQQGTAFQAELQVDPAPIPIPYPNLFRMEGTVGLPAVQDGVSRMAMIGRDPHGIIAILIGLLLPAVQDTETGALVPAVRGSYVLFESPAGAYDAFWRGTDTSFDHGTYNLPAVQSIP